VNSSGSDRTTIISAERIEADIEAIAALSETPVEAGHNRPTFGAAWARARDYLVAQATAAGCVHRTDAAGNIHIRHASHPWTERVWLSGSHIDSVPSGGKYDGVMGVVVPLEILRSYPALPLELVVFAEEEGTTFGVGMLGSRGWAGEFGPDVLGAIRNADGRSFLEAGAPFGVDAAKLALPPGKRDPGDRIDRDSYVGLVEVHPEQGLSLWRLGCSVAAVDRIAGRRQYSVTLTGQENHAGSTGMLGRRDALAGAAELVVELETLGLELDGTVPGTVLTVGSLTATPGAINVIAGSTTLTIDFRSSDPDLLDRGSDRIRETATRVAYDRGLECAIEATEEIPPRPMSADICERLTAAAASLGVEMKTVTSGALHDAAVVSPYLPTAMIFVASRDGISHNPDEFSRIEDVALAARILATMIETECGIAHGRQDREPAV